MYTITLTNIYGIVNNILDLFQCYCRDWTTVHCLPAVAGIAGLRVNDPGLVVPEFKNFWAELDAKPATDAEVHINVRGSHYDRSFLSKIVTTQVSYFASSQGAPGISFFPSSSAVAALSLRPRRLNVLITDTGKGNRALVAPALSNRPE